MKLIGDNGDLELYEDKVVIKRSKGLITALRYQIFPGDKTIFLKDITGIRVKNTFGPCWGYIQFTLPGSIDPHSLNQIRNDVNTVTFGKGKINNALAHRIKSEIENRKSNYSQDVSSSEVKDPDMIRKYKQLFDDGIITREEFEAKKKEILGL